MATTATGPHAPLTGARPAGPGCWHARPVSGEEDERVLAGGNLTRVVRVGDTVRREAGPWTPLVHDLLRHVRAAGFELAPEPLGSDQRGREVLSYLPGVTLTGEPWPAWVWSDALLVQAAGALARYHRAVAGFRPATVTSRLGTAPLRAGEIVCHNDFAPYNCTFEDGRLTGVFDWDVVSAAPPAWDLAFLAWQWVPLRPPVDVGAGHTPADAARRLRLLVDAYGLADASGFVDLVVARIQASWQGIVDRAAGGDPVFERLLRDGHAAAMERAVTFVRSLRAELTEVLDRRGPMRPT